MPLHNPLSRLRKAAARYEFEVTVQTLRMRENANPSKELVYVEMARNSKRFKTNKAFVHTGDISWDDTFQFTTTLYKGPDADGGEPSFDRKEFSISFLEYNHFKSRAPRVLCKGKIDLAAFALDDGSEVATQCHLNDRSNTPLATLTLLVKGRWTGDARAHKGPPTRIKVDEVGEEGAEGGEESDDGDSSCSLSTRVTRSTAASRAGGASAANGTPGVSRAGQSSGSSFSLSAASDSTAAPTSAVSEPRAFRPSLRKIESADELTHLASRSPRAQPHGADDDAQVLHFALGVTKGPAGASAEGFPTGALVVAAYAAAARSARFGLALSRELRAALHRSRGDARALAQRVAFASVLHALVRAEELRLRAATGRAWGRAAAPWSRKPTEHERQVAASLSADVWRHLCGALDLYVRKVCREAGPHLAAAFVEAPADQGPPAGRSAAQHAVLKRLTDAADALAGAGAPPAVVAHAMGRILAFVDAQLFNTLLERWELCNPNNGVQIKLALSLLDEWLDASAARCEMLCARRAASAPGAPGPEEHGSGGSSSGPPRSTSAPRGLALPSASAAAGVHGDHGTDAHADWACAGATLAHVRQAADVLIVSQAARSSTADVEEICPALRREHVARLREWAIRSVAPRDSGDEGASPSVEAVVPTILEASATPHPLNPFPALPLPGDRLQPYVRDWSHARTVDAGELCDNPRLAFLGHLDFAHLVQRRPFRGSGMRVASLSDDDDTSCTTGNTARSSSRRRLTMASLERDDSDSDPD